MRGVIMSGRDRMVERQILKAQAEGQLSNLSGEGQPLPDHPEAAYTDAAQAAGFRIMAEAGALPEEIPLGRAADAVRVELASTTDPVARKVLMAKLADLEMRKAIAQDARRRFLR
jgi:hypothetical protein